MHIVFCCDRRVLPGLHVAAYSLVDRFDTSQSKPEITIFSDALNESDISLLRQTLDALAKPYTINLHQIDTKRFADFPTLNGSWATYYRLYAFETLEAEKLLYIDADTLCDIDVSPLESLDLGGHPAAWVPEAPLSHAVDRGVAEQLGGSETDYYFNAGVMLVNVAEWRQQCISQRAMDYITKYQPMFHDQSALNFFLYRNSNILDPKFNCLSNGRKNWTYLKKPYGEISRLIHFLDYPKPWDLMAEWVHPQFELWRSVLDKTAMKDFRSWHSTPARKLPNSSKARVGYKKAIKDRSLFFLYSRNILVKIKGQ